MATHLQLSRESTFSGFNDLPDDAVKEVMAKMPVKDVKSFCLSHKRALSFCKQQYFWEFYFKRQLDTTFEELFLDTIEDISEQDIDAIQSLKKEMLLKTLTQESIKYNAVLLLKVLLDNGLVTNYSHVSAAKERGNNIIIALLTPKAYGVKMSIKQLVPLLNKLGLRVAKGKYLTDTLGEVNTWLLQNSYQGQVWYFEHRDRITRDYAILGTFIPNKITPQVKEYTAKLLEFLGITQSPQIYEIEF